jgi:adenylosuccinate synthase
MPAYGVIGAQWGDEGKGKVVDFLASNVDMVVRFSGGNNAGHTVINSLGEFKLHLVPAGIFRPGVVTIMGGGMVVNPEALLTEIEQLQNQGVDTSLLYLSNRAHVVMPYHVLFDQLEESARGDQALGTTGRGIGPAYADKTARMGIRIGDLLEEHSLKDRLSHIVAQKNLILTKIYETEPLNLENIYKETVEWGKQLKPYITHAEDLLSAALFKGKKVLLEGAQGTLLDLDHGTYPFVTSSSSAIGGAPTGLGFSPREIKGIIGVFKAYSTRVGSGPMPSEIFEQVAKDIRERAGEYGTTTGRARRVGWFDGVAAKYSAMVNGYTSAVLTRLDVLDGVSPVKICVAYDIEGKRHYEFPNSVGLLEKCQPIFEELPGWSKPTFNARRIQDLPPEAITYVRRLESLIGCPIDLISTGPRRDESILLKQIIP